MCLVCGHRIIYLPLFFIMEFNNFSILSWNVRGAANTKGKRHVRELIRKYHSSLFVLMETHVQFDSMKRFWCQQGYEVVAIEEAIGHSSGLWVLSSDNRISISILESNAQAVTICIKCGRAKWVCSLVYASPTPSTRDQFWLYLEDLRGRIMDPWLLLGDFNEVLLPSEVRGGVFCSNRARRFSEVLENCTLVDLGATGSRYTWRRSSNRIRTVFKRLDRAVSDCDWRNSFPEAFVENPCRMHSDHNPMLLRCGGLPAFRGTRPFRFEAIWTSHQDSKKVVGEAWNKGNHAVMDGLDDVREDAVKFNEEVFGNVFRRKRLLEARIRGVQKRMKNVDSSHLCRIEREL